MKLGAKHLKFEEELDCVKEVTGIQKINYITSKQKEDKFLIDIKKTGWLNFLNTLHPDERIIFYINEEESVYIKENNKIGILVSTSNDTIKNIFEEQNNKLEDLNNKKKDFEKAIEERENFLNELSNSSTPYKEIKEESEFRTITLTLQDIKKQQELTNNITTKQKEFIEARNNLSSIIFIE